MELFHQSSNHPMRNLAAFSQLVSAARPSATAILRGSSRFPDLTGIVLFYPANPGSLVAAEFFHLPHADPQSDEPHRSGPFFGFHLHEGTSCGSGDGNDPFAAAGDHYNPAGTPHPFHAGDFPAVLGDNGYGYISFYTGRFSPQEAVGRTVILHRHPDDFHTQPSGNSGTKLACGVVTTGYTNLPLSG